MAPALAAWNNMNRITIVAMMLLLAGSHGSDPDPINDFDSQLQGEGSSFTLRDIMKNGDVSRGPGGTRAAINRKVFPAMASGGVTYVRFQMVPCGINLPHTHPRATEMLTLIQGGPLQVGFVDTSGVAHIDILNAGDVTIFPRGLMHFELNVGSETALYLSALNSENPGTLTIGGALFKLPMRALASTLNMTMVEASTVNSTMYSYGLALQKSNISGCIPDKNIVTHF